ncbi:hypothetical protein Tsp_03330 [Trichinella spiralis]|uniref:hypothetical protein n=1 Tax=Trichinella spiralis TaxID=6334 RepID=UPI0001EFC99D|nr:hypothetical protein Tsp_03330 [Trichinella spiralis]
MHCSSNNIAFSKICLHNILIRTNLLISHCGPACASADLGEMDDSNCCQTVFTHEEARRLETMDRLEYFDFLHACSSRLHSSFAAVLSSVIMGSASCLQMGFINVHIWRTEGFSGKHVKDNVHLLFRQQQCFIKNICFSKESLVQTVRLGKAEAD